MLARWSSSTMATQSPRNAAAPVFSACDLPGSGSTSQRNGNRPTEPLSCVRRFRKACVSSLQALATTRTSTASSAARSQASSDARTFSSNAARSWVQIRIVSDCGTVQRGRYRSCISPRTAQPMRVAGTEVRVGPEAAASPRAHLHQGKILARLRVASQRRVGRPVLKHVVELADRASEEVLLVLTADCELCAVHELQPMTVVVEVQPGIRSQSRRPHRLLRLVLAPLFRQLNLTGERKHRDFRRRRFVRHRGLGPYSRSDDGQRGTDSQCIVRVHRHPPATTVAGATNRHSWPLPHKERGFECRGPLAGRIRFDLSDELHVASVRSACCADETTLGSEATGATRCRRAGNRSVASFGRRRIRSSGSAPLTFPCATSARCPSEPVSGPTVSFRPYRPSGNP